jgi:glycosyltransferase involved in cell wall biosynthesis
MKVVLVYLGRKGGGPVYSLEIAKRMQYKTDLFCVISEQVDNFKAWQEGIEKIAAIKTYTNLQEFALSFFDWPRLLTLRKKIKEFKPDVIYFPFFHFWLLLVSWWFPKVPKVYTAHDPILHQGEKNSLMGLLQKKLIKQSKRVIILSAALKPAIPKPADSIDVIPHGIFDYYLKQAKDERGKQHPPTLLFFGRILDYKGLDILLKAFSLIKKAVPEARLLIAGSGSVEPYQSLLSNQEGIILNNKWIEDKDVAGYFLQADVLVCPYRDASQSGAIPVAYVFKMPVIATKTGGLVEQVDDQKTGLLVGKDNVQELAMACIGLLQNRAQRADMGEAGYKKATSEWSWESISDRVLISLKKAISGN